MLRAADALADLVRAARSGGTADAAKCSELATELRRFSASEPSAPDEDSADDGEMEGLNFQPLQVIAPDLPVETETVKAWQIRFKPHPLMYAKANETGLLLRELKRLGHMCVQLDASALPQISELDSEGAYLSWTIRLDTEADLETVREVFEFVEGDCDLDISALDAPRNEEGAAELPSPSLDIESVLARLQANVGASPLEETPAPVLPVGPAAAPPLSITTPEVGIASAKKSAEGSGTGASATATIRVDLDRVDRLIDLVGELVINQAMLAQRVTEADLARSSNVMHGAGRIGAAHPRDPGQRHGDPRPAGAIRIPAHAASGPRSRGDDRQNGPAGHRGRSHRGR